MAAGIPPPPLNSPSGSYYWLEWYTQLTNILNGTGYPWTALNFANSNIHDIITRNHNSLQNVQGGTAGGDSTGTGNAWHMTGRGFVSSSGTGTGFPGSWSVAHPSAGTYVVTHNLGAATPTLSAIATSNTTGVSVQWIDTTASASVTVHLVNTTNTATDGGFSLIVMT